MTDVRTRAQSSRAAVRAQPSALGRPQDLDLLTPHRSKARKRQGSFGVASKKQPWAVQGADAGSPRTELQESHHLRGLTPDLEIESALVTSRELM